jgi:hypothetical protein
VSPQATTRLGVYRTAAAIPRQWFARLTPRRLIALETPETRLAAQWRLLHGRRLRFERSARLLHIPAVGVRLPMLADRALRLASGRCPPRSADGRSWVYTSVDLARARDISRILGLPLESTP